MERASADQPHMRDNAPKDVCEHQLNITSTLFTVGIPEAQLDALPERKSFRASLRALPWQSTKLCSYLCLNCRQAGHVLADCPHKPYHQTFDWTLATEVHAGDPTGTAYQEAEKRCSRCEGLTIDLRDSGNPVEQSWPFDLKYDDFKQSADWVTLGSAASLLFHADCSFCRLLFSVTQCPTDWSGDIILTKANSNRRLGASRYLKYGDSAAFVYTTIRPTEADWNRSKLLRLNQQSSEMATDAICAVPRHPDNSSSLRPLGGRRVDRFSINASILSGWLRRCEELHGELCSPEYWDELQGIRLVDVVSRQVVRYPSDRCDYIALSYIWGKFEQRSYTLGSHVETVPQTIEDAMTATKLLGKRYLWVDSLTIDQSDSVHKAAQIKLMSSIYRGAWATIVALSGRSAASGLPRVNTGSKQYPDIIFPQMSAVLDGIQYVSTMPTLAQQMRLSHWDTRAWTLQEGLLSPRCLYFTQHEVYFQCNTFQCCESIDDSTSLPHNERSPIPSNFGVGILRSNFLRPLIDERGHKSARDVKYRPGVREYCGFVGLYSTRNMTSKLDKINAFSGILQALETLYFKEHGFHYGVPVSELPWSLLWEGDCIKPLIDFPSWSWAGWEMYWMYTGPPLMWFKKEFQTYLRILRLEDDSLIQIYHSAPAEGPGAERKHADPLRTLARQDASGPSFPTEFSPVVNISHLLFVEGIVLSFILPQPATKPEERTDHEFNWNYDEKDLELGGVKCTLRYLISLESTLLERLGKPQTFLLLARDLYEGKLTYWLLLLDEVDGIMYRHQSVRLTIPHHQSYCVLHAKPRRTRLVLG